jgi:glycosyltransferase involved in cell wall biosynthesis
MLGPSDVRKNISRLMPVAERCHQSLKFLSDYRLPVGVSQSDALDLVEVIIARDHARMPLKLAEPFRFLTIGQAECFSSLLASFLAYFHEQQRIGNRFDFTDCALGNLLFAGCYLQENLNFNQTIQAFSQLYEVAPDALLNITQGEDLFLIAEKADGSMLLGEADIVAAQSSAKISDLFLIDEQIYRLKVEGKAEPAEGWSSVVREGMRTPRINPAAATAIAEADVIIYGPGTQHSSLFPSYMTEGVVESISANRYAEKIFVGNIVRDLDIQEDDINDLARKFMRALSRNGAVSVDWRQCVTHFFVQHTEDASFGHSKYIPFDPSKFMFPLETVRVRDWEAHEGRHSGGFVLDELQQIVQARIDVELQRIQHMVSIVVPVLNEQSTLEDVLKSLVLLDFQPLGMTKEIVVVDGGSIDASCEIARSVRGVRLYQLPQCPGRGAALRLGIEKARGSIVAFFPGDREYLTEDLYSLVRSLAQSRFRAVLGTRAMKVRDLSEQIKSIYADNRSLYLTSKYGGIMLSILTLLLYNRFITDVLTSVKVFDAQLLRSLQLECEGRDLDTEIIAKLALRHEYILELPVEYKPRTRLEGKKITLMDGIKALGALFHYRMFARQARGLQLHVTPSPVPRGAIVLPTDTSNRSAHQKSNAAGSAQ